jgi:hypothetical protein
MKSEGVNDYQFEVVYLNRVESEYKYILCYIEVFWSCRGMFNL